MFTKIASTLILITLSTGAFAQAFTVDLKMSDKTEQLAVDNASESEIKQLVECVINQDQSKLDETACINDVLGDIHN